MPYPDNGAACPILNCPKTRAADQLMCGRHWKLVPHYLQRLVNQTWRTRMSDARDTAKIQAHEDAKRLAIAAVEQLQKEDVA